MSLILQPIAAFARRNGLAAATGALAVTALLLVPTTNAHAVPITYTYSGTASGTVGATTLTDELFLITYTADTDNITTDVMGTPAQFFGDSFFVPVSLNPSLPTFTWGNISGTFTPDTNFAHIIFVTNSTLGNGEIPGFTMFAFTDPAFSNYDLTTPMSFAGVPETNADAVYSTNQGDFNITGVAGDVAFNALGGVVVPEASTFALTTLGMIGTAYAVMSKRRKLAKQYICAK